MTRDRLSELVQDVIDGRESGLKAYAILKEQSNFLSDCLKEVEPVALDEAEKHSEKTFEHHGYKFERREGSKIWNFKPCENWQKKKDELKNIEDELKTAWQNSQHGNVSVDSEGEIITLPEVTYRKDSLIVKQ